jgi:hypothetical protein
MNRILAGAVVLGALTTGGCNNSSTSATAPTAAAPSISETFTGVVSALDTHNGSDFHNFTVTQSGTVNLTLNAAGPPTTIQMGVGLGQPTAGTCPHTFGAVSPVQAGPNVIGSTSLNAGTYCVDVYDIGNAAQPINYSVTVAHP